METYLNLATATAAAAAAAALLKTCFDLRAVCSSMSRLSTVETFPILGAQNGRAPALTPPHSVVCCGVGPSLGSILLDAIQFSGLNVTGYFYFFYFCFDSCVQRGFNSNARPETRVHEHVRSSSPRVRVYLRVMLETRNQTCQYTYSSAPVTKLCLPDK